MTRLTTILIGLTFLTSCDCYKRVAGTVIDNNTGSPLQGVTVYNKSEEWSKTITDTAGHFEMYYKLYKVEKTKKMTELLVSKNAC